MNKLLLSNQGNFDRGPRFLFLNLVLTNIILETNVQLDHFGKKYVTKLFYNTSKGVNL